MSYPVETVYEQARGCGFRKPDRNGVGIYLCCDKPMEPCERLPYRLHSCPTCGGGIRHSRGFTWIEPVKILSGPPECKGIWKTPTGLIREHKHDVCPVCRPQVACPLGEQQKSGLIWIGHQYYRTPHEFIDEALSMGVSRKVPAIPRGLHLGRTWIYLGHLAAMHDADESGSRKGLITAYQPTRVDLVIESADDVPDRAKKIYDDIRANHIQEPDPCRILVVKPKQSNLF